MFHARDRRAEPPRVTVTRRGLRSTLALGAIALGAVALASAAPTAADAEGDESSGPQVSVSATAVVQGVLGPGSRQGDGSRRLHAPYSADLGLLLPVRTGGALGLVVESGLGAGPDAEFATLSGFNADAVDDPAISVSECWYEQAAGVFRVRAGSIDLTTEFDNNAVANSETDQFLSPGFVNNLAMEFPGEVGPGIAVTAAPVGGLELALGAAEADGDWTRILSRPFLVAQLSQSSPIFGGDGTRRVYAWKNNLPHEDIERPARADEAGYGYGLSFDQAVGGPVALFARVAHQRNTVYTLGTYWSAGLQASAIHVAGLEQTLGFATGSCGAADAWVRLTKDEGASLGHELHFEIYDNFHVTETLAVTVDLQRVDNPELDSSVHRVWVPGLRLQYTR